MHEQPADPPGANFQRLLETREHSLIGTLVQKNVNVGRLPGSQ